MQSRTPGPAGAAAGDRARLTRAELLRRGAAGAGLVLGAGPFLAACGGGGGDGGGSSAEGTMTFTAWGGTTQEAQAASWTMPFAKQEGLKIRQAGPTDYGRIKAMVQAKRIEWDVVDVEGDFARRAGAQGLLEEIDYTAVPKADILPQFVSRYGVGDFAYSFVIAYDPKRKGGGPANWAEFFDTQKFPGKRSFYKYPYSGIFEAALLADGVSPEQLYPLDFDRAFKKLDTIKDDIVWWESGAQSQQYMSDGSVDFISAWNGRMYDLMKKGVSVEIEWNQNLQTADYLVVPKGSERKDEAMKLIAYSLSPEPQAKFAERTAFAPVNEKALKLVKGGVLEHLSTTPQNRQKGVVIDDEFWAKARDQVQPKWDAWLVA